MIVLSPNINNDSPVAEGTKPDHVQRRNLCLADVIHIAKGEEDAEDADWNVDEKYPAPTQ